MAAPTAYTFVVDTANPGIEAYANDLVKLAQETITCLRAPPANLTELPDPPLPVFIKLTNFVQNNGVSLRLTTVPPCRPAAPAPLLPKGRNRMRKTPAGGLPEAIRQRGFCGTACCGTAASRWSGRGRGGAFPGDSTSGGRSGDGDGNGDGGRSTPRLNRATGPA